MDNPNIETVPKSVKLALLVLLNHVEPGWENCKAHVNAWLDSQPDASNPTRQESNTATP